MVSPTLVVCLRADVKQSASLGPPHHRAWLFPSEESPSRHCITMPSCPVLFLDTCSTLTVCTVNTRSCVYCVGPYLSVASVFTPIQSCRCPWPNPHEDLVVSVASRQRTGVPDVRIASIVPPNISRWHVELGNIVIPESH